MTVNPKIDRRSARHGGGYERVAQDFYPTLESWPVEVLLAHVSLPEEVWEPACGQGHMSRNLEALGRRQVHSTDLVDRGYGRAGVDFLAQSALPGRARAIVTNPPNGLLDAFIRHGLELTRPVGGMVCLFVPLEFHANGKSLDRPALFAASGPHALTVACTRRPVFFADRKAQPKLIYCWEVWDWQACGQPSRRVVAL